MVIFLSSRAALGTRVGWKSIRVIWGNGIICTYSLDRARACAVVSEWEWALNGTCIYEYIYMGDGKEEECEYHGILRSQDTSQGSSEWVSTHILSLWTGLPSHTCGLGENTRPCTDRAGKISGTCWDHSLLYNLKVLQGTGTPCILLSRMTIVITKLYQKQKIVRKMRLQLKSSIKPIPYQSKRGSRRASPPCRKRVPMSHIVN